MSPDIDIDPILIQRTIRSGRVDAQLDNILSAIKLRKEALNSTIRVRDTVRFNSSASPKYLQGLEATVTKVNRKTVSVDFPDDASAGRFRNAKRVRAPFSIIDKV